MTSKAFKGFYNLCCKEEQCSEDTLDKWLTSHDPDISELIRSCDPSIRKSVVDGILRGSIKDSFDAKERRFKAADAILSMCSDGSTQGKDASEILEVLSDQIHTFSFTALVRLIEDVVDLIEDGHSNDGAVFSFIPLALSKILPESSVSYDGEDMKGCDYRALVIGRMLHARWHCATVVQLLGSIRDIQLSDKERLEFVGKALEQLKLTQLASLPPLVYQIMLLAGKGKKGDVIRKIAHHFEELDAAALATENDRDLLRQTEHTVLLHIDFAVKQDAALGGEFLRALQKEPMNLSPFIFSLLLSMSRVHRHHDKVLKFLTHIVMTGLRVNDGDDSASNWFARARDPEFQSESVRDVLLATAKAKTQGWNPVIEPLVSFSMDLMQSTGRQSAQSAQMCLVGREILEHAFRSHGDDVRMQILTLTVNHILTHKDLAINYVDLLKRLVNKFPHEMAAFHSKLKEVFDHLAIMSPQVAFQLVQSVMPLLSTSIVLKDHLMIVLRKAMFRGQAQYQLCAAGGFVEFLLHNRDQKNHAFEAISFLERGLSQHPNIRRVVYRGLVHVALQNTAQNHGNPEMNKVIGTVLSRHMRRFVDLSNTPPIQLECCIEGDQVVEPLGALIHCAQSLKSFGVEVKKLILLMRDADMEDYSFDKTSPFDDSALGIHNRMSATVLCEAYIAALEFHIAQNAKPVLDDIKTVCKLFGFVAQLRALMYGAKDGDVGERKKKGRKKGTSAVAGIPPSIHRNLAAISLRMLVMLACDEVPEEEDQSVQQQLRDDKFLMKFMMEQLLIYVSTPAEGTADEKDWRWAVPSTLAEDDEKRAFCRFVGPAVFLEFQRDQQAWNQVVAETVFHMMKHMYGENKDTEVLLNYMQVINPQNVNDEGDLQEILLLQLKSIYSFVGPMVDGERWKEVIVLFRIIEMLYESLEEQHVVYEQETLTGLLSREIKNAPAAKAAVSLFLALASRTSKSYALVRTLCSEIRGFLGMHEEGDVEGEVEPTNSFKVINSKTVNVCIGLTFAAMAKTLDEIDGAIAIVRGNERSPEFDGPRLKNSLHRQLVGFLRNLDILLGARFDWGTPAERIVRMSTKAFSTISKLVKIYGAQKYRPGSDLIKVFTHTSIAIESIYPFLSMLAGSQDEDVEGKKQEKQMKANHRRESKLKPALIYSIEMLETTLIKYQDQVKVGLMKNWKRSTVRDFKIDKRVLKTIQTRLDGDDDDDDNGDVPEQPIAKKKKVARAASKRTATSNTPGRRKKTRSK